MKKFSARVISVLISLSLMFAFAAAGCKNNESASPSASAGTGETKADDATEVATEASQDSDPNLTASIKLGIWPADSATDDIATHNGYVEKLHEKYPNITVVPANYDYSLETYPSMATNGTAPTIFQPFFTEPPRLISSGLVAPISDTVIEHKPWVNTMSTAFKTLLSGPDGKLYGIPRDTYALGFYININLFEQAGLMEDKEVTDKETGETRTVSMPLYPKTWDELLTTAQTIKDKTGKAGFCLVGQAPQAGWQFTTLAWNFGAIGETEPWETGIPVGEEGKSIEYQDADGNWHANFDSDAMVAALEFVKKLRWNTTALTDDPSAETYASSIEKLGSGVAAMCFGANDWVDRPTATYGLSPDKFAIAPVPAGSSGKQYMLTGGTAYMFAPNATDDEIEACLDYLEVMGRAPIVTDEVKQGLDNDMKKNQDAGIPVIPPLTAWDSPTYAAAQAEARANHQNVDLALYADYYALTETAGALVPEPPVLTQNLYAALSGPIIQVSQNKDADCKAVLQYFEEQFQQQLDKYNEENNK